MQYSHGTLKKPLKNSLTLSPWQNFALYCNQTSMTGPEDGETKKYPFLRAQNAATHVFTQVSL